MSETKWAIEINGCANIIMLSHQLRVASVCGYKDEVEEYSRKIDEQARLLAQYMLQLRSEYPKFWHEIIAISKGETNE